MDQLPGLTNELLGYIKDAIIAVIAVLTAFEIWTPTEQQLGAILALYAALGAIATAFNSRRKGGAVQALRTKAAAADAAGIAPTNGG